MDRPIFSDLQNDILHAQPTPGSQQPTDHVPETSQSPLRCVSGSPAKLRVRRIHVWLAALYICTTVSRAATRVGDFCADKLSAEVTK